MFTNFEFDKFFKFPFLFKLKTFYIKINASSSLTLVDDERKFCHSTSKPSVFSPQNPALKFLYFELSKIGFVDFGGSNLSISTSVIFYDRIFFVRFSNVEHLPKWKKK